MLVCCFRMLRNVNGAWTLPFGNARSAYMRKDPYIGPVGPA